MSIVRHEKTQLAFDLLKLGFRTPIIVIETDLSNSSVGEMARSLSNGKRASSGRLPSTNYFISNSTILLEASLFANIYKKFSDTFEQSIDLPALIKAYELYAELREDHPETLFEKLDINKCWIIARDLRAGLAWFKKCKEDHSQYLVVEGQRIPMSCPLCSHVKKRRGRNKKNAPKHKENNHSGNNDCSSFSKISPLFG